VRDAKNMRIDPDEIPIHYIFFKTPIHYYTKTNKRKEKKTKEREIGVFVKKKST
jgi:hypothetical protein